MYNKNYIELDKIILDKWVDQTLEQALTKRNIKFDFRVVGVWPLDPNAMNNKFQPSSLYTTRPSNEGSESDNTLDE
jgi:hypothetical protein